MVISLCPTMRFGRLTWPCSCFKLVGPVAVSLLGALTIYDGNLGQDKWTEYWWNESIVTWNSLIDVVMKSYDGQGRFLWRRRSEWKRSATSWNIFWPAAEFFIHLILGRSKLDDCLTRSFLPKDEMINGSTLTGVLILVRTPFHNVSRQVFIIRETVNLHI
jgi:hypothetical protein